MISFRPATHEDFVAFGRGGPFGYTVRAWAAEKDGKILGLGGYSIHNGAAVVFTGHNEEMTKKDIIRAARFLMEIVHKLRLEVFAIGKTNGRALQHYGFEPCADEVWRLVR